MEDETNRPPVFGGGRALLRHAAAAVAAGRVVLGLAALAKPSAGAWHAAGALSDALDFAITVAAWPQLPRATRWLIAASAGGAAVTAAAGTVAFLVE